jgi:hypothetical protein
MNRLRFRSQIVASTASTCQHKKGVVAGCRPVRERDKPLLARLAISFIKSRSNRNRENAVKVFCFLLTRLAT